MWDKWGNLSTCACGWFRVRRIYRSRVRIVKKGIKRWLDKLFDAYLVEESMWDFRVLIVKTKA